MQTGEIAALLNPFGYMALQCPFRLPALHLQIARRGVGCSLRYRELVGEKKNAALRAGSAPTRAQTETVARFQTTGDRAGDRLTLDVTQAGPS